MIVRECCFLSVCMWILSAAAEAQVPPPPPPASARQVPLSGREQRPGSVAAEQTTGTEGGGAVGVRGSVNVQGAYTGSVPSGDNTGAVLPLRLDYALKMALRITSARSRKRKPCGRRREC